MAVKVKDAFDWLVAYKPQETTIDITDDKKAQNFKRNKGKYFISGYIEPNENGQIMRNNETLIRRNLIVLDYDEIANSAEFLAKIEACLKGVTWLAYPTLRATKDKPRYRIIIQPSRPLEKHEYQYMAELIASEIPYEVDASCLRTWSQVQGLPVMTKYNKDLPKPINKAKPLPIPERGTIEPPKPKKVSPIKGINQDEIGEIPRAKALEIFNEYVQHDAQNLHDYTNSISAILVLAKAVQNSEIDYTTAVECAEMLAMGNEEWALGNMAKLNKEISNADIRTQYTFKHKFHDLFNRPMTMKDLALKLEEEGELWRERNTETDNSGKEKAPPIMHPLTCANILRKHASFALIGDKADTSPLYVYNYDAGIYQDSETLINQLIKYVEYRYNPPKWKYVIGHLRTDVRLFPPLQDRNLIAVNNGIYDAQKGELLPFAPHYMITSKIATDYNENASKPSFFDVDEWISSLACGDEEVITLLWQVMNEAINPNHTRKKMGFLIGDGNNGKGTYQKLITSLIGLNNISTLKPIDFGGKSGGSNFKLASLMGKVCNIGDDISSAYVDEVSDLMSVTTGDPITVEIKHGGVYSMELKLFCLFSGNAMPKMRNKSHGLYRRLLMIPFNADFNGQKENPLIKEQYVCDKQVLEYVLKKVLSMRFDKFVEPKATKEMISDYKKENDYIVAYVHDVYIPEGYHEYEKIPVPFIKQDIKEYIHESGGVTTIKYHFVSDVIKTLEEATGGKYKSMSAKFNTDYINTLPFDIQHHVAPFKVIRTLVKLDEK